MTIIRTIIVDDSAFVRKIMTQMLASCPQIEVVGTARNGLDALSVVAELNPDVVTCDLFMPELDGVGFVRQQMERRPLPIIISTASPKDADRVLEALEAGAVDFIQKPTALANNDLLSMRVDLIHKIKLAAEPRAWPHPPPAPPAPTQPLPATAGARNADVIVLGISTGGPQALRFLVPQFPADFPVPVVIVLHIPVGYTALFAERLAEISRLPVREATEGCLVKAPLVLIAPAGQHLHFIRSTDGEVRVQLSLLPLDKPHRPSVDVLFHSAAEVYQNRVLAVVMTGMGDDGKKGSVSIKARGGTVLTEAEESCVVYGMPRTVVEAGLSDQAVPLRGLAGEISKRL